MVRTSVPTSVRWSCIGTGRRGSGNSRPKCRAASCAPCRWSHRMMSGRQVGCWATSAANTATGRPWSCTGTATGGRRCQRRRANSTSACWRSPSCLALLSAWWAVPPGPTWNAWPGATLLASQLRCGSNRPFASLAHALSISATMSKSISKPRQRPRRPGSSGCVNTLCAAFRGPAAGGAGRPEEQWPQSIAGMGVPFYQATPTSREVGAAA